MKISYKTLCNKALQDEFFLTEFNKTESELQIWNLQSAEDASLMTFLKEKSLQKIRSFGCMLIQHTSLQENHLSALRDLLSAALSTSDNPINLVEELDLDAWGRITINDTIKGVSFHRDLEDDCMIVVALEDTSSSVSNYWNIGLQLKKHFLEDNLCNSLVSFKGNLATDEGISFYKNLLEDSSDMGIFCVSTPRYRDTEDSTRIPISNSFPIQDEFLSKIWKKSRSNFLFETLNALLFVKVPLSLEDVFPNIRNTLISRLCLGRKDFKEKVDVKGWGKVLISGMAVLLTYTEKTENARIFYIACPGRDPQEYQDTPLENPVATQRLLQSMGADEDLRTFVTEIEEVLTDAEIH